jgi:hypothetical protein
VVAADAIHGGGGKPGTGGKGADGVVIIRWAK